MSPLRRLIAAVVALALVGEGALSVSALALELARRPAAERRSVLASGEERAEAALGSAAAGWRAARDLAPSDAKLWVAVEESEAGLGVYMRLCTLLFGRSLRLVPVPAGETIERRIAPGSVAIWLLDLSGGRITPDGAQLVARGPGFALWKA